MSAASRLLDLRNDPEALEALYREDPEAFRIALAEARAQDPASLVLRAWEARLGWSAGGVRLEGLGRAIALAAAVALLVRLPALALGDEWYYPRFLPSLVLLSLCGWFWLERRERALAVAAGVLAAVTLGWAAFLPGETDSVVVALIHLPLLWWVFLGRVFTGGAWRSDEARIRFIRYNGELVVLGAVVGLAGLVFSGVTVALFSLMFEGAEEPYFENVGLMGAVAVPVAATWLYDRVFRRRTGIPAMLARVFAPLFLAMALVFLGAAAATGQNPFVDRSFLVTFNAFLLVVSAIVVFAVAERDASAPVGLMDRVNLALGVVTLVIDLVALAAIVFRLASYGFTPNRVVVLLANVVLLVHLARVCAAYLALVRGRAGVDRLRAAAAGYLPVYGAYAAIVVFLLPLAFRFA